MRHILIYLFLFISLPLLLSADIKRTANEVEWLTFEKAVALNKKDKKKIFIDVYTDWCGWCKKMDQNTFSHDKVAAYLSENFYNVKLDGEGKEEINFNGQTFKYVPSGAKGYHELAAALLQGKLSYPTVVFMDEDLNIITPVPGYMPPERFYQILTFLGEDHYKDMSWEEYSESYESPF